MCSWPIPSSQSTWAKPSRGLLHPPAGCRRSSRPSWPRRCRPARSGRSGPPPGCARIEPFRVVGGHRRKDDEELVSARGPYVQVGVFGEGHRTDVQRGAGGPRHPLPVQRHELPEGRQKEVRIDGRQAQPLRRAVETGDVPVGPEQPDGAVLAAIGLEPLEDALRVVEHHGGRLQGQRAVGHDAGVAPPRIPRPVHEEHVIGEHLAETQSGLVRLGLGPRGAGNRKLHLLVRHRDHPGIGQKESTRYAGPAKARLTPDDQAR